MNNLILLVRLLHPDGCVAVGNLGGLALGVGRHGGDVGNVVLEQGLKPNMVARARDAKTMQ